MMKPASSRPRDIAPHGRGQHVLPDQLTSRKAQRMVVGDESERERDTAVLLPEPQCRVRFGVDLSPAAEGAPDDVPAILVRFPEIDIWEVACPVLLVRAIAGICEITVPMPYVEEEVKMQALGSAIDHFIPSEILEARENLGCTADSTVPNRF